MGDVPLEVEIVILGLDGVRIDRHVLARGGLEPDDPGIAGAAALDAPLVSLGRVILEKAH
jgi:hypothetical protein